MRLTDDQKNEILRHLEDGKPLPSKYRFLLFDHKGDAELVWDGKTGEVCNIALPFQVIEHIDEPRDETRIRDSRSLFDTGGRQIRGWANKLIWGDNKLALSSLRSGELRREIEDNGGIKLIYIDPPFDVGADFSMDVEIGDDTLTKEPSILEQIAYRDTWGQAENSYIAMIYERLSLMHDLLADDGSIYVHCDYRVSGFIRLVLDEIFGKENFMNHIIWGYKTGGIPDKGKFAKKHDDIFFYVYNNESNIWNSLKQKSYTPTVPEPHTPSGKQLNVQRDEFGKYRMVECRDIWNDINAPFRNDRQLTNYPTQKPEALLERIIKASSNENDIVADFFCGSGTTAAVAEKLGRKWIAADLGKFAIHTTRKRLINTQRQMKTDGKDYRAFNLLNLGKYERQYFFNANPKLSPPEQEAQARQKWSEYTKLILRAYNAQEVANDSFFHGKKAGKMVVVGPINLPVSRRFVEELINECKMRNITAVDILAFEFEMGIFPQLKDIAQAQGTLLSPKYIPPEVFDKRAVERGQVAFYDVAYIAIKPHIKKQKGKRIVTVELTQFSTHYTQNANDNKAGKIIVDDGQVYKNIKDAERELLTKHWSDWVDYWAVDFNYESRPATARIQNESGEWEERLTGDYIFENEWQSFRAKRERKLEFTSAEKEIEEGRVKIAVKVVDIMGNDTMKVVEV